MGIGGESGRKAAASLGDWIAAESIDLAAEAVRISAAEIRSPVRERARAAFGRQMAIYIAHVIGRVSMSELAGIFQRDRSTVAHAVAAIEDRRDDPFFSARMDLLEADLAARLESLVERWRREAEKARERASKTCG